MRRLRVVLDATAIVLLLAAWAMSTRPFSAPDEVSHYLRAATIADGHWLGPRAIYPGSLSVPAAAFVAHNSRAARLPARLVPPGTECVPIGGGRCVAVTPTGSYAPPEYVLPAAVLTQAGDATTALWLSRLVSSALCAALLIAALGLMPARSAWGRLGFGLALSPMVFFVCSILNSSALEIAAATCFLAAVLRIAREPGHVPGRVWLAAGLSGALTIASFQAGPLFAAVGVLAGAVLLGRAGMQRLASLEAAAFVLVLLAAFAFWYGWGQASGSGYANVHVLPLDRTFSLGLPWLGSALRDAVGTFGAMTIFLPNAVVWVWWGLVLVALVAAFVLGSVRERCALGLVALIACLAPIFLYAWVQMNSGFGLQGRYVLPLFIVLPLLSGHVLARRLRGSSGRATAVAYGALAVVGGLQAWAWLYNAPRNGMGAAGEAGPPLGWAPWVVLMALAVAIVVAAAGAAAVISLRAAPAAAR